MKNYILEIKIKGLTPQVIRRLSVPEGISFRELHDIIQIVFQWGNYHMYKFMPEDLNIEITCDYEKVAAYEEYLKEAESVSDEDKELSKAFDNTFPKKNIFVTQVKDAEYEKIDEYMKEDSKLNYIYDFGDYWHHVVKCTEIIDDGDSVAKLISAKGITPPEDVGGVDGYNDIRLILEDENHENHEEMMDWARTTGYTGKMEKSEVLNERLKDPAKYFQEIDTIDFDLDDVISDTYK